MLAALSEDARTRDYTLANQIFFDFVVLSCNLGLRIGELKSSAGKCMMYNLGISIR